jgi:hypothetical protein
MITLQLRLLRLLPFLCGGRRQLAIENLALRRQLAVYKRTATRPRRRTTDRLFWQRRRFREYWAKLSNRPIAGRPAVNAEIRALVTRMAAANPLGRPENSW